MAEDDVAEEIAEVTSAPLGDMIASVGRGLAAAQEALDRQTIENFKRIHAAGAPAYDALRSIGYMPTWYQIPELEAEMNVALSLSANGKRVVSLEGTPVNATYTNRFGFDLTASSTIKFKVVPVPPSVATSEMRATPDYVGLAWEVALAKAGADGVQLLSADDTPPPHSALIVSQTPPTGEILPTGAPVIATVATQVE